MTPQSKGNGTKAKPKANEDNAKPAAVKESMAEQPKVEHEKPAKEKSDKKKKPNAAILAIKRMQDAKRAMEEQQQQLEEEERRREEEIARQEEEKTRREEAEKKQRRERRKARNVALRQEGTKAERERLRIDREKVAMLLQISPAPPNTPNDAKGSEQKKQRPVYTRKKQPVKKTESTPISCSLPLPKEGSSSECDGIPEFWEDAFDSLSLGDVSDEKMIEPVQKEAEETVKIAMEDDAEMDIQRTEERPRLMSPILCVLGHVDTGKTKLLDKLRETSVQAGEAGGITQQIGATFFPCEAIVAKMHSLEPNAGAHLTSPQALSDKDGPLSVDIPGLVVIDTPGHASFANLRSRGSSLCHLAVLVVDLMHGIEPQTLESIELLRARRTPFIVALNKIDRIFSWTSVPGAKWCEVKKAQNTVAMAEFEERLRVCILAFAEQTSLNAELHERNTDFRRVISLIPISALTGEGVPDLLRVVVEMTQQRLGASLLLDTDRFDAIVLEVRAIEGLGTIIDTIVCQGTLSPGDRIVVGSMPHAIVTEVRALLTPEAMRETRVKVLRYVHHEQISACMGVRIVASGLESAVAGSRIIKVVEGVDEEAACAELEAEYADIVGSTLVERGQLGVGVQASTLGSLEALLTFLAAEGIPVATASIGTIYKRDVLAASVTVERHLGSAADARDYAVVLAFDVKIDREAQDLAEELGIIVFQAEIIYHLLDAFQAHRAKLVEQRKRELSPQAVFPCHLRIVPGCVFNKRSPLVLGVTVAEGSLRIGTPLAAKRKGSGECVPLGRVTSIHINHRPIDVVRRGGSSVAIKIETTDAPKMYGRHFDEGDEILSLITRTSIDILKTSFREEMTAEDWQLVRRLKPLFGVA